MSISFNSIPNALRVPFVTAEFSNAGAVRGVPDLPYRILVIGQRLSGGTWPANTIQLATSVAQVAIGAGRGSMLHRMAIAHFQNNPFTETWFGVLDDNGAGVQASGTVTITGPATAAGTVSLYLGGVLLQVGVNSGDSATTIAAAVAAAINANGDLPVTASPSSGVVTVTHRHKGVIGNTYDMRVNYQDGEATPAGVTVAIVALASGTTTPTLTSLISAMGDTWFQILVAAYTDSTSLSAIETELSSRFGSMRMIDGVCITSAVGTESDLATIGSGRNSQHVAITAQPGKNPLTPPMEFAAAVGAVVAFNAQIDPARPFQTLPLVGVLPVAQADLFTLQERNLLLYDGISTSKSVVGGVVQIERMITTYQTAASGADDASYLDVTTMLTLLFLRYSFRTRVAQKYPRHKLANDGTRYGAGQAVVTPSVMKGECIAWFRDCEERGLVENFDAFKASLVVERNASDPNRLDVLLPPDLINSLIVTAAQIQFIV